MTFVIGSACIDVMDQSCIEVCPVDCIYMEEDDRMCFVQPDECIDCGVCEPECPADAILPDTDPDATKWIELNRDYSEAWPVITLKKDAPSDADEYKGISGKLEKFFSPTAGKGD